MGSIREATDAAVEAAGHLTDMDKGAVATLKMLADRIDVLADNDWIVEGKLDNVSVPTYLRYCEQLGLTPAGRRAIEAKKEGGGGKLAQLRSIQGGKAAR